VERHPSPEAAEKEPEGDALYRGHDQVFEKRRGAEIDEAPDRDVEAGAHEDEENERRYEDAEEAGRHAGTLARVAIFSNGHGEDVIGREVAARLRRNGRRELLAFPMVGAGAAYRDAGIPTDGPASDLPAEGFSTLGLGRFARDLSAGWLGVQTRQMRFAVRQRGRMDLAIGVGDVVPLVACRLSRAPFLFVACAKSQRGARGHRWNGLETGLMRRSCGVVARDPETAARFQGCGVPVLGWGNPLVELIDRAPSPEPRRKDGRPVVLLLPGSRRDAGRRVEELLDVALLLERRSGDSFDFVLALAPFNDGDALAGLVRAGASIQDEGGSPVRRALLPGGGEVAVRRDGVGAWAARCDVAIGLAGTANEQAAGLGVPLVTWPTDGVFDARYVRMKRPLFGEAQVVVPPRPEAAADAILTILSDPRRREAMSRAGRARMAGGTSLRSLVARAEELLA